MMVSESAGDQVVYLPPKMPNVHEQENGLMQLSRVDLRESKLSPGIEVHQLVHHQAYDSNGPYRCPMPMVVNQIRVLLSPWIEE